MSTFLQILQKVWGYSGFRPLQEDIIRSICEGQDTLALMPTGGGKSITFQLPALAKEGICLVITPLIALMKDQVESLKAKGIKALAIHSGMDTREISVALDNCIYGDYKFLYLSPERIGTDIFRQRVQKMNVCLITVDEAHCISQWGYDFRPSYLKIVELRDLIPYAPIAALTATATPIVADDIMDKLRFKRKNLLKTSFERKNLAYIVRKTDDKPKYLLKIAAKTPGSGIVYVRSRKQTKEISELLQKSGFSADFYHAGLTPELRSQRQDSWKWGKTKIIVATNAFGMGIDKPDVRFTVHMDVPDSIEAYFQEAGRAGRDGQPAYAVLLYNDADRTKADQRIRVEFPPLETIKKVYQAVCTYLNIPFGAGKNISYDFNLSSFAIAYKIHTLTAYSALQILQREGYLELTDEMNNPSRVMFTTGRDELYKFQVNHADLDAFIKLLLRAYSGLFSEYVRISEEVLAKTANISLDMVYTNLKTLSRLHIISYIPRKKTPVLFFNEERLEDANLRISNESYAKRKQRQEERIAQMLEYSSSTSKCRSQLLLAYFGETATYRCGICDVCKERNEIGLSTYEFDLILDEIKKALHERTLKLNELVDNVQQKTDKTIKVIRWLLDNGKLIQQENGVLTWHTDS
ncbi:MAG: RecQ family ATP-dependent DNA helicase [Prevotellaceae bacterium]|jgi:ATP-dependent DNA helicase RecQ|nr:RecQ family ATP-dependent DNA helicase [Prevotellaceae bacterium]